MYLQKNTAGAAVNRMPVLRCFSLWIRFVSANGSVGRKNGEDIILILPAHLSH